MNVTGALTIPYFDGSRVGASEAMIVLHGCSDDQPVTTPDLTGDMAVDAGVDQRGDGMLGDAAPAAPTFADVQAHVTSRCGGTPGSTCHLRAPVAAGLDLSAAAAYAAMVNVDSLESKGTKRVEPGHPEQSFIVKKLTNAQGAGEGAAMPQREGGGWTPLAAPDVDLFVRWIAAGAKNDADI